MTDTEAFAADGEKDVLQVPDESVHERAENVPWTEPDQLTPPVGENPVTDAVQDVNEPTTTEVGAHLTETLAWVFATVTG